ncbi:MAG TPA: redoxin domain-containing protein [Gemmatimonadaceae bacterium]|nr:redoxin domain-containing protein [Gemmatimonadaceae bacterium]
MAAARLGLIGTAIQQMACAALVNEGTLPSLSGATEWINSPPLTSEGLRGKVVLVDFWTYTCVNWTRTLPYVRAWAEKYKDQGLVVIGAHTPEFPFEKDVDNIRWAATVMNVNYPIAVDSDYGIWRAFDNNYWPAVYIADVNGTLRFHHFGEGNYDGIERTIQRLLNEAGKKTTGDLVKVQPRGLEVAADYGTLRSGENYLGYRQGEGFASDAHEDAPATYTIPSRLSLNQWALNGNWTIKDRPVVLNQANGSIAYRFHGRDVNLIMSPPAKGQTVRFTVKVDGKPPGASHGEDTDAQGNGTVSQQRCYQLIRLQEPVKDRTFEIQFAEPGVEAYDFTFG